MFSSLIAAPSSVLRFRRAFNKKPRFREALVFHSLVVFHFFPITLRLLFIVRHVVSLCALLFVAAAVEIIPCLRRWSMAGFLLILHICLTSASFHNPLFSITKRKTIPVSTQQQKILSGKGG
jgi:hypothetical protein